MMEPIPAMDPAHDNCSVVSGPEVNGVSDDKSRGRAGENHPMPQPRPIISTFTDQAQK